MGSCSNKSNNQGVPSIKTIPAVSMAKVPIQTIEEAKSVEPIPDGHKLNSNILVLPKPNVLFTTVNLLDESTGRKSRKNLTVLTTNEEHFKLPEEFANEMSLVMQKSEGKPEQGSLILVKFPITIGGRPSPNMQSDYEEKLITIQGDDLKRDFLLEHGTWVCCKKGLKPESPNQDDFLVIVENHGLTLGVFDGHGTHGHEVSNFVHNNLPVLLLSHASWELNPLHSISECFPQVHNNLIAHCNKAQTHFDCTISGCTSTVLTIRNDKIYVGHVGDSRAVLAKITENSKVISQDLTRDHKPTLSDEMARIVKMGGEVKKNEGDIPFRVFKKDMKYPGIAMSRALGDAIAQTVGVTCIPEVSSYEIKYEDQFILVCSDGVWEFISSQEAVEVVSKQNNVKEAAEALAQLAWDRWIQNEGNVVDDITVIVTFLRNDPEDPV